MEPGGRLPAPGALALVQAFVNTNDIEGGRDALRDPERLRRWLLSHDLLRDGEPVSEADHGRALAVREALRAILLTNNGGDIDVDALRTLNTPDAGACLTVRFDGDGCAALEPARSGLDRALGRLLAIVYTATVDGTWPRLKACRNDVCRWAFYDASKNRSGTWCTMAICGGRLKARAYRRRVSPHPPSPSPEFGRGG